MKRFFTLLLFVAISAYAIAQKELLHLYGQIPKDVKGDTIKCDVNTKGHLVLYHRNKEILIHGNSRQQSSTAIMWKPDKHNISLVWYRDGVENDFHVKLTYKALNYFDKYSQPAHAAHVSHTSHYSHYSGK